MNFLNVTLIQTLPWLEQVHTYTAQVPTYTVLVVGVQFSIGTGTCYFVLTVKQADLCTATI